MDLVFPTTAAALGRHFDASVIGDADVEIRSLASLAEAEAGTLTFCSGRQYSPLLNRLAGVVLFTHAELVRPELPLTYLVVANPQLAFAKVARLFSPQLNLKGISPRAQIDPSAVLARDVAIGPYVVIEAGAQLGAGTAIHAYSYIGSDVSVGEGCHIYPRVTLLAGVRVANRVKIFPGTVVGSEGFGFMREPGGLAEMPQIGSVVIEDDVRIGANCTIDRGTLGETRIGRGTKIDDQVHVGHNAQVGKNCALCGQVAVGGSAQIGDNVVLGGQAGVGDHIKIGAAARLGGGAGATQHLDGNQDYFLTPAMPLNHSLKVLRTFKKLPELAKRLRHLEKTVSDFESQTLKPQDER